MDFLRQFALQKRHRPQDFYSAPPLDMGNIWVDYAKMMAANPKRSPMRTPINPRWSTLPSVRGIRPEIQPDYTEVYPIKPLLDNQRKPLLYLQKR